MQQVTNEHAVFFSMHRVYSASTDNIFTRVEAGSNTSTVTLRVVRGDEMGLKKAAP
jgi:hypothetical protein